MIAVPRWFSAGLASGAAAYAIALAVTETLMTTSVTHLVAFLLFLGAFSLCITGRRKLSIPVTALACGTAIAIPALALSGVHPSEQGPPLGSWAVPAVGCLAVLLLFRQRALLGWCAVGVAALETYLWGGLSGVTRFGVFAELLLMGVVTAGAVAMSAAERELRRFSSAEREDLRWWSAQQAYHEERETRLATMAALSEAMLHHIADEGHLLGPADRRECQVLHSTIRDETRGKRLLNDAVRAQVLAHRRRGARVQLNDDGGLDDIDPATVESLLDRVADAITDLHSDCIVIRTCPSDSVKAITVAAMSTDPVAAALGMDDGEEQVDLWLELDRPNRAV